ncbi:hypothetical protein [Hasllibacter sp. MH4015]|nr:hypothetical protein [Hasllibacter sp. MH4015]
MAIQHIAVFLILGVAFVVWTVLAKRKEAAAKKPEQTSEQTR